MEGVRQRGLQLQNWGHSVELVTLDEPGAGYISDYPLPVHALGQGLSSYRYNKNLVPWLLTHAKHYDAVVINGLWQYHAFGTWRAMRQLGMPYYVFTHGMLDPWFKRTYPVKHAKKWLLWPWADYRVLRDAAAVLFTSDEERRLARQSFWLYRAREQVVAYGTSTPPPDAERLREAFYVQHPHLRGKRLLLFLGRLHEKKGCDLLVQAFAQVAANDANLHLVMAGPDDTGLQPGLAQRAETWGVANRIAWIGMVRGDAKWGAFYASEVFVLPSHQENFGISVAEALACGLPVLISDQVNIWREIEADGAGLVAPDTLAGTEALLRNWLALAPDQRQAMAARAQPSYAKRFSVQAMAQSLLDVIRNQPAAGAPL
jgi:glycosyltransferase involved in cell wall biosynthesis